MTQTLTGSRKAAWLYGLALACLLVDQATKQAVRAMIDLGQVFPVMPGFNLTHVVNKGAAFSLLHGHVSLLVVISLGVALGIVAYERRRPSLSPWQTASLGILLGGTVGNLIDRAVFGQVTDFLDVYVGAYHWPTFNVADICINLGVLVLLVWTYRQPAPPHPPKEDSRR